MKPLDILLSCAVAALVVSQGVSKLFPDRGEICEVVSFSSTDLINQGRSHFMDDGLSAYQANLRVAYLLEAAEAEIEDQFAPCVLVVERQALFRRSARDVTEQIFTQALEREKASPAARMGGDDERSF